MTKLGRLIDNMPIDLRRQIIAALRSDSAWGMERYRRQIHTTTETYSELTPEEQRAYRQWTYYANIGREADAAADRLERDQP